MADNESKQGNFFDGLLWWAMLTVAVLAIPSLAFVIVSAISLEGIGGLVVFVLSCWICTFIGMKLMHRPKS